MTSVSADHIILTPTQPVASERPQRESNPGPPHQESLALATELPSPPGMCERKIMTEKASEREKRERERERDKEK